jgi:3-oxoacyl-[acyl-carrier-protein] synthase II
MTDRQVWITGYGLLSPIGQSPAEWWRTLSHPNEWRAVIDRETYAPIPIHTIADYALAQQVPKTGDQRAMGPMMQYGAYAAGLALDMAGLKNNRDLLEQTHLITAAGGGERDWALDQQMLGAIGEHAEAEVALNRQMMDGLRPTLFLSQLPNLFAGNISLIFGVSASSRTFMGEEQAGFDAVRIAFRRIAAGTADICLVGAAYSAARPDLHLFYQAGGILLSGNWQPLWRRPDAGVMLGSAGAFVVLEARESAERRGITPRGQVVAIESTRSSRKAGASSAAAANQFASLRPRLQPGPIALLSGASGRGSITGEEREFLAGLPRGGFTPVVRGTAAALGHAMEAAFPQNLALAVAILEQRRLFAALDPLEPIEAGEVPDVSQILVTSWGHLRGEGMALLERVNG